MVRDSTISPADLTQEALRARVRIHPKTGCREYTGACDADGYGSQRDWFDRVLEATKLPDYTLHCNRHTFASRLVMNGVDLRTVG